MTRMWTRMAVKCVIALTALAIGVACAEEPTPLATASAMARVTKRVSPDYPPAAKQLNLSGTQEISLVVGTSGDVEEAKVVKGNAVFSTASLNAVKQWKFTPLTKDGQASKFATVVVINYQR